MISLGEDLNKRHIKLLMLRVALLPVLTATIVATDFHAALSDPAAAKQTAATLSPTDRAWKTLKQHYDTPPSPLRQLPDRMYTQKEIRDHYADVADRAGSVADEARAFYTRYPRSPNAAKAKDMYFEMLHAAVSFSGKSRIRELEVATAERIKNPKLDSNARFELSMRLLHSTVSGRQYESDDAMRQELERRARQLARDYPDRPDGYAYLVDLARVAPLPKSVALAYEVLAGSKDRKLRVACRGLLTRAATLDKRLDLTLTTNDGKSLNLSQWRGKPILLLFWDSASKYSAKSVYIVNNVYNEYRAKGLEVVGLNFDDDLTRARSMINDYKLEWPQYLDKQAGWTLRERFGVESLPLCWFVDKNGVLCELHGERNPYGIAEKLLAE